MALGSRHQRGRPPFSAIRPRQHLEQSSGNVGPTLNDVRMQAAEAARMFPPIDPEEELKCVMTRYKKKTRGDSGG